jgi:hypothetical protein
MQLILCLRNWWRTMTSEEAEKMNALCRRIITKKDPQVFDQLVHELNQLLELKHKRIHPEHASQTR